MIEKFDVNWDFEKEETKDDKKECLIIPKLKPFKESPFNLTLERGDTLVMFLDLEKYDTVSLQDWYEVLAKTFPDNQIIIVDKGAELGVIKEKGE